MTESHGRRIALGCLVVVLALNAAAFLVRTHFVATSGAYASTTGFEEFSIYHVWKVVHGHPLYEWPQKDHYLLTHYNGGFYFAYAAWAKLWGTDGEALVPCARMLTPLFALFGMVVLARLIAALAPPDSRIGCWKWGLAGLVWFGTSFNAWSVLTTRPDIAAVAFALAGFAVALRALERDRIWLWAVSSGLFFTAWFFKQTVVWIFAGTILHALLHRPGWRSLAALIAPFAVLAAGTIAGGGEIYRYSIFGVPKVYRWFPLHGLRVFAQAIVLNLFIWCFGGWAWLKAMNGWRRGAPNDLSSTQRLRWRAAATASIPPLVMGVIQISVQGSSANNFLEAFVMISLLAGALWSRTWTKTRAPRTLSSGAILLLAMMPLPAVQLVQASRGIPYTEIRGISLGNLTKLNPAQLAQRRDFVAWMHTLPKPLWSRDAMFQQPWFATDNRYPAFLRDSEFEPGALAAGVLEGEGVIEWIRRRHFAAVLVYRHDEEFSLAARAAGYAEASVPAEFDVLASEYGIDLPGPRLFVREPHRTR